ncbi:hypothetical protein IE53DRAFT_274902 [Violaceomyces palustris]|uniref:Uncharacterized protein n=1 Tax=Violaceomyces palustris TaxID=1673888 RepID=A0ACD0NMJ8_9BASI|nr:hypothetical protein IE53DRAFT_274902 [Violaceomyces palustris]
MQRFVFFLASITWIIFSQREMLKRKRKEEEEEGNDSIERDRAERGSPWTSPCLLVMLFHKYLEGNLVRFPFPSYPISRGIADKEGVINGRP